MKLGPFMEFSMRRGVCESPLDIRDGGSLLGGRVGTQAGAPVVSFLTIAKNEGAQLRSTLLQLLSGADSSCEVICLNDGSTDDSFDSVLDLQSDVRFFESTDLGVAAARNAVALQAQGQYLVFVDAHMTLPAGWWQPLIELLDCPDVGAVQPSLTDLTLSGPKGFGQRIMGPSMRLEWLPQQGHSPYPVPALCGCCFAVRRDLFFRVGGMDGGMYGWGAEDCEFSMRLWRLGYQLLVDPKIVVGHHFRTKAPYAIDWKMVLHNNLRAAIAHFSEARLEKVMDAYGSNPYLPEALDEVEREDIWAVRSWLDRNCVYDDEWFLRMSGKVF